MRRHRLAVVGVTLALSAASASAPAAAASPTVAGGAGATAEVTSRDVASVTAGRATSYCPRIEKAFDTVLSLSEDPLGYAGIFKKAAKRFTKAAKAAPEAIESEVKAVATYFRGVSKLDVSELGDIGDLAEDVTEPYQVVLADANEACGLGISNVPLTPGF